MSGPGIVDDMAAQPFQAPGTAHRATFMMPAVKASWLDTGAVTFPHTGFSLPSGVAIAPSGGFALVANTGGNHVGRIDLGTGAVTFPHTGFSSPYGVAIAPSVPTTSTIPTTATTEAPNQNNSPATRTGIFDGLLMLVVAATMLTMA